MNYRQTLDFLFGQLPAYHRVGKAAYKNTLENSLILDEHTGHPHLKFKSIHIAGTNGKGSVSHLLASVLQEAGYKTGLYTSPHLKDFRERIRVNGEMIPEEEVISFVQENSEFIGEIRPSFFEITVAMAFSFFEKSGTDAAVIEVGLGGRLDSTNIITPVLSVITNIGHDHMDLLGDTLEKVAAEKAGIIKPGVPVIISETHPSTNHVFSEAARKKGSEIIFADRNYSCRLGEPAVLTGEREYVIESLKGGPSVKGITMLGGDYQARNITAVFQACETLSVIFPHSEDNVRDGIRKVMTNTGLSGRWQILGNNPLVICDTGHNREGLEYVVKQLARIPAGKLHMVVGFVNDKDLSQVLPLLPKDAVYYFTKAVIPRALNEETLKEEAGKYDLRGNSFPNVSTAVNAAKSAALPQDVIFIGGSTFIVADAL